MPPFDLNRLAQNVDIITRQHNGMAAWMRSREEDIAKFSGMADLLKNMNISSLTGGSGSRKLNGPGAKSFGSNSILTIDDIAGRCYPFEATCDIAINSSTTDTQPGNIAINMDGPFVAVGRYAVFRSNYTFSVSGESTYLGRSNGRFRSISSASDYVDALRAFEQLNQYQPAWVGAVVDSEDNVIPVSNPMGIHQSTNGGTFGTTDITNALPNFPGTGRPYVASPSNGSPYRTMGFDGLIAYDTGGSNFRRTSNTQGIPSEFWDSVKEMGCYDVFEPNDVVQFRVTPTHPMNPQYGNIQGLGVINPDYTFDPVNGQGTNDPFPVGSWPWIGSQYDGHEGINGETLSGDDSDAAVDRVTRLPDGVLTIGFWGYKIVQAPPVAV